MPDVQVRSIEQILQLIFDPVGNTIAVATPGGGGGSGTADSTAANQTTEIARLTSILAKIIAAPATEAKQDTLITGLASILSALSGVLSVSGAFYQATQPVSAAALPLPSGASTEATLASILTKLADPATQTTLAAVLAKLSSDPATQTTLAAVLAKLTSDPSTATLQGTANTSLASILAKIITAPATEAKQDTGNTSLASILSSMATAALQGTGNTSLASILALLTQTVADTTMVSGSFSGSTPVDITCSGHGTCMLQLKPTGSAGSIGALLGPGLSVNLFGSVDGTNFLIIYGNDIFLADGQLYNIPDKTGFYAIPCAGFTKIRLEGATGIDYAMRVTKQMAVTYAVQGDSFVSSFGTLSVAVTGQPIQVVTS